MNEIEMVRNINQFGAGGIVDIITSFISDQVFLIVLWSILITLAFIIDKKNGKLLLVAVTIGLALHFLISEGFFKYLLPDTFGIFRLRPWIAYQDIATIGNLTYDSSFPSSHMSVIMMMLTVFISFYRKYWIWALLFLLVMGFARIHNGMHFPSDVIGGIILGFLYGALAIYLTKRLAKH